jgi:hypothetical protein
MNQPIARTNTAELAQLSEGTSLLKDLAGSFAIEAIKTGKATLSIDDAMMLFAGVDQINELAKQALVFEADRAEVNPAPTPAEVAAAQPSMTKDEFVRSWSDPRDEAGVADLKAMSDEPVRLPPGVFVLKGSPEEIQAQVAEMLQGVFRRPPAAH